MPKKARDLSPIEIKRITKAGLTPVGHVTGLGIAVTGTGSKSWKIRIKIGSKRRDIGLGSYPSVSLKEAIETARAVRDKVSQGIDPVEEREVSKRALQAEQAKLKTFEYCAHEVIKTKQLESSNAKHSKQWQSTLETYAFPVLAKMPVAEVDISHVLQALRPIWYEKTETAYRVRGRIEAVLAWAKANDYRDGDNPATWKNNLDAILPAKSKIAPVKHFKRLDDLDDIHDYMKQIRVIDKIGARALEFSILTANRIGAVLKATWSQIDLSKKVWIVPAENMKGRIEYRIPLSSKAIGLLDRLPRQEGCDYLFSFNGKKPISEATVRNVIKAVGKDTTTHGFRSLFRDWMGNRTSTPHDLAEMCLAHSVGDKVTQAYRRDDMLERRRPVFQMWADFIETKPVKGTVSDISQARSASKD